MARKFFILALLAAFIGMACAGTTPEGIEYLKANKLKEGVVETSSGLQYRVLKEGPEGGPSPSVSTPALATTAAPPSTARSSTRPTLAASPQRSLPTR